MPKNPDILSCQERISGFVYLFTVFSSRMTPHFTLHSPKQRSAEQLHTPHSKLQTVYAPHSTLYESLPD